MRRIDTFVLALFRPLLRVRKTILLLVLSATLAAPVSTPYVQAQTLEILYSFKGNPDGAGPYGGLLLDPSGNLYGTTNGGGASDAGTVFKLDRNGSETIMHSFAGYPIDGAGPFSTLIKDAAGNFYGTTWLGGLSGYGTVFKLDIIGNESLLHSFAGPPGDGATPFSALTRDVAGNLFGTTFWGGQYAYGSVFKLDSSGVETLLYSFGKFPTEGINPYGGLIVDAFSNLYGTTQNSVSAGAGTIFRLSSTGHQKLLYRFRGAADGSSPLAGLIHSAGSLYGTTGYGGDVICGCGTVFKLDRQTRKGNVLHSFIRGSDGAYPQASPVRDAAGNLFGTTAFGGDVICDCGTVYKIDSFGNESVLYRFTGAADGSYPISGLTLDAAGNLYGTTSSGGIYGLGTVFKLVP